MREKVYQDKIDKLQNELDEYRQENHSLNVTCDLLRDELNDLKKKYTALLHARPSSKRLLTRQLEIIRQDNLINELDKKLHAGGRAALSHDEQAKIRELRLANHTIRQIAEELHHSTRTIQKYTVSVDDERTKESKKEKERNEIRKKICPLLLAHIATDGLPPINKFSCPVQEGLDIYSFFDFPSHNEPDE